MSIAEIIAVVDFKSIFAAAVFLLSCGAIFNVWSNFGDSQTAAKQVQGAIVVAAFFLMTAAWYSTNIVFGSQVYAFMILGSAPMAWLVSIVPSFVQAVLIFREEHEGEHESLLWAIGAVDSFATFFGILETFGVASDDVVAFMYADPKSFLFIVVLSLVGNTALEIFMIRSVKRTTMTDDEYKKYRKAPKTKKFKAAAAKRP